MSGDFAKQLEQMARESTELTKDWPRPIASVFVNREGRALDINLDTSKDDYNEWIPGEGGDIGLDRDRDTNKVNGARLPLYAKTLIVGGFNFSLRIDLETGEVTRLDEAAPAPKEATPEEIASAWPEGDKLDEYLLEEAIMVKGRVCEFVIGSSSAMIVCDGQYLRPQGYWSNIEFHYPNEAFARRFAKTLSVAADLEQAAKDFWEEYEKTKT